MPRRHRPFGVLTIVVAGTLALSLGVAPASAVDYPSWDEVEDARQDEAAAARAVENIESLLSDLEAQSAELSREALIKGEEYNEAKAELDAASAKADRLDSQAQEAEDRAAASSRRAGQLIAQLSRTGGSDLSVKLLMSEDSDGLLSSLGTMNKLSEQSAQIYNQAIVDQNLAQSLTDQAEIAEDGRRALEGEAQEALAAAQSAADELQSRVAEQQASADQMYAQLASLKGTTAEIEQRYIEGVNAPPPPTVPTAPSNPGTPSNPGSPGTPTTPTPDPNPPAPSSGAVETAIAFAYAQLGEPYLYGGSGPDRWDCSGLTKAAYAAAGVYIGIHSANSQYNYQAGLGHLVAMSQIQRGDLLFYSSGGSTGATKYHVTIYLGGGQMLEAPVPGTTVTVSSVRNADLVPYAARPTA